MLLMRRRAMAVAVLAAAALLGGCASAYSRGETALLRGRYSEAVGHFRESLAREQFVLDATVGLGIASYKLGAIDEAIEHLRRAVAQAPDNVDARFYLGLSYLRKKEDTAAREQLQAFLGLNPDRRLETLVKRALGLLQSSAFTEEVRSFVTLALENEASWVQDVRLLDEELRYARRPVFVPYYPDIILVPVPR
jgi:tetratricopeptide (TPR) repeat protein